MKTNRILSTAGVCPKNSTKLRSYCNLMQGSLKDKWLFADDFVESHVCIIRDDYLNNVNKEKMELAQVIIVLNESKKQIDSRYQITPPLTAAKIKDILNLISKEVKFKPLSLTKTKPKVVVKKFKSAFSKIRRNFFGNRGKKMIALKKTNKEQFLSRITKKISPNIEKAYKVVLLGSPGSGKTTAINSASDGKALSSDVSATDSVANDKAKTTVGIDYADVKIPNHTEKLSSRITLFGTPGQIKFNFIWDIVGKNADAFIILLDMSRPEPLSYLKFYYKFLREELGKTSQVYCALTHCEKYPGNIPSIIDCIESEFPKLKGVYQIDARNKKDLTIVLTDIYPQIKQEKTLNNNVERPKSHLSMVNR